MKKVNEDKNNDEMTNSNFNLVNETIRHTKTSLNVLQFSKQNKQNHNINPEPNITRKSGKIKTGAKKSILVNVILQKEDVYPFFSKNPNLRTPQEISVYAKYLSKNYQYFTKLKNEDSQLKVEKLTKVCKLQKTLKGDSIINFGEIGDKFYIVLEGKVEIYKPVYVEITATPSEFIGTLYKIRKMDGNDLRFNRIKEKNKIFFESLEEKEKIDFSFNFMKYKQLFIMEKEEKLAEFGEGFSFGDIALLKKTVRNATIKAKEDCILLTIEKNDYNKALLEFQKKKLSKEIEAFLKTYSFFKYFSHDKIINLFNLFSTKEIYKGEYLYKQNEEDESIYFVDYGTFSIECLISFSWINEYINYINYSGKNILQFIIRNNKRKINELLKIVEKCKSQIIHHNPINNEKYILWEKVSDKEVNDNLYKLKKDEEKLNDPEHIFTINLKKINSNEIIGLEEIFEFKKRFCNCRCISEKAEIRSLKLNDFLKLIINFGEDEINYFINIIEERKNLLKNQIINRIKNIEKKLIFNFEVRYDNIIKSSHLNKNENDKEKKNLILSTIKMKGYKDSIKDLLDKDVTLLDNKKEYNNIKKIRKKPSIDSICSAYGLHKKSNNEFKYKIIKNCLRDKVNQHNNEHKENILSNTLYDLNKKPKNQNINNISNYNHTNYNNKYGSNSYINKSFNTTDSFKSEKKLNLNLIKFKDKINNYDSKYSNDKTNISSDKTKLLYESPKIKILKFKQKENKNYLGRNSSMPNFNIFNKNKKTSFKDSITSNDTLPKLRNKNFFIKSNDYEPKILIRGNNDYNNFYNIYNEDKNFFLGIEFQKKLKKEFKYNSLPKKDNILKI